MFRKVGCLVVVGLISVFVTGAVAQDTQEVEKEEIWSIEVITGPGVDPRMLKQDTYPDSKHKEILDEVNARDVIVTDKGRQIVLTESFKTSLFDPEQEYFPEGTEFDVQKVLVKQKGSAKSILLWGSAPAKKITVYKLKWLYVISPDVPYADYEKTEWAADLKPLYRLGGKGTDTAKPGEALFDI